MGDLSRTRLTEADVDLSAASGGPDGAIDAVTVEGTPGADRVRVTAEQDRVDVAGLPTTVHLTGSDATDRLQINGRDGNDEVHVDADVNALVNVAVDLGAGQH